MSRRRAGHVLVLSLLTACPRAPAVTPVEARPPEPDTRPDARVAVAPDVRLAAAPDAATRCPARRLVEVPRKRGGVTPVWMWADVPSIGFEAGLSIDADGGRNAYRADDHGLDTIKNACNDSGCFGVVTGADGKPVRQPPPRQDYFVSPTSLQDRSKARTDPERYVDSETVPYLALPLKTLREAAARAGSPPPALGDLAVVINRKNGKRTFAIFADAGPSNRIGEGSIALADALGIPGSPRRGGTDDGVQTLVFVGSGNGQPRSPADILRVAEPLFSRWGGPARLDACRAPTPER